MQYVSGTWNELEDVTLVAKWTANNYTVTYDDVVELKANVVVTLNPNYSGATATTVTLNEGQILTCPAVPTRSGYAFAGWYTDSSCTTKYSFSGTITENITLYAKWHAKFTQQEFQIRDSSGRRWIQCELCGEIKPESEFGSYGGINHVNLGVCYKCSRRDK